MLSENTTIRPSDATGSNAAAPDTPTSNKADKVASSGRVVLTVGDGAVTAPDDKTVITNRPPLGDAPPPILGTPQTIGEALVGKTLDHYELVEFVGGGGMGAVFRANDTRLGRTVAVKVLSRDQSDEETIRRFRNEAQSAARLDHPNIARVFFVGESGGWNYIVFEFIEGINLRDLVDERGPLSIEDALSYTLQIAEALAHSSSRDVVHRDIKPSNILMTAGGQAKLVDMGLARLHQVESSSDDLTASGVTLGTFDYISPEQARDPRVADVRSDIYSLGCTLYYLLTGQPPFPEGTALQKLLRHNDEERPDVRQLRPEVPPSVAALVAKMLAKRPSQRQQTPAELIASLIHLGHELGLSSIIQRGQSVQPAVGTAHPWTATAWQLVGAVALLAAAVVVLDSVLSAGAKSLDLRPQPKLAAAAAVEGSAAPPAETVDSPGTTPAPGSAPSIGSANPDGTSAAVATSANQNNTGANAGSTIPPVDSQPSEGSPGLTDLAASDSAAALSESSDQAFAIAPPPMVAAITPAPLGGSLGDGEHSGGLAIPSPARRISRLIVASQLPAATAPEIEYVSSLATACRRAGELNLSEIELQWDGRRIEAPIEVASPKLTLRAGTGFHPIVVFQPQLSGLESTREMIRLSGGSTSRVNIQGVELRMELPSEPSYGWSLFAMQTGQSLELEDCVLTVQNTNELHSQVAMIDVRARRPSETMTMADPQPSMASPTRLSLDRCIARGAATVIGMQEETPLSVRWNQGLIVTPRRLITTGGSTSNPTRFEDIAINLIHVTAVCREGLYQVERRPGAAYQLAVDVVAEQCILMTDEQSPLYEFVGVSNVAQGDLHYDGQGNLYPNPNAIFLRYRGAGGNLPVEHSLKQRGLIWSEERNPQTGDPWESELDLSLPPHSRTKFDFLPTAAMTIDAGYDSAQLPEAAADQPPMAAPPMPPIPMSPSPPAPTGVVPASAEGEAE